MRPNATLEGTMRLYSDIIESVVPVYLLSPFSFKTSNAIGGVYICRVANQIGTRDAILNITVKGNDTALLIYVRLQYARVIIDM